MTYLNGRDLAVNLARREMPCANPESTARKLARIRNGVFGNGPLTDVLSSTYHSKFLTFMNEAQNAGINPSVALAFSAIFLHQLEQKTWSDCSSGQNPIVFLASNTSEVDPHVIFGNGTVSDGRMSGYFGLSMNARKTEHVGQSDDFVPFSYMFAHSGNKPPAAILFFGAYLPTNGEPDSAAQAGINDAAMLAAMRKALYIKRATDARHWIENDLYLYVPTKEVSRAFKIPIIAAVYDGRDRVVRTVDADGKIKEPLYAFIEEQVLLRKSMEKEADSRLATIANNLRNHEQDKSYPLIMAHARSIKEVGCVDARIAHAGDMRGMIKEIGSALTTDQMVRIASSPFSSALIYGGHTGCGYLNTLLSVHMASSKLRTMFGEKDYRLRRMLRRSLNNIAAGDTSVQLGDLDVQNAIEHTNGLRARLNGNTNELNFLLELMCSPADDLRATLYHALSRGAIKIDDDGLLSMPAAANVEEMTRELLPSATFLTKRAFDVFVTEESTRIGTDVFNLALKDPVTQRKMLDVRSSAVFDVAPMVMELRAGQHVSPAERLPQNIHELQGPIKRNQFYRPSRYATLLEETIAH